MKRPNQAGQYLLDQLDWHLTIGQLWQTLGTLWGISVFHRHLFPDWKTAVSITSMVYHHPEATSTYRDRIDETRPLFVSGMAEEAYNSAWEKGRGMEFDTAVSLVRTALTADV
jgi:hypothetical protein